MKTAILFIIFCVISLNLWSVTISPICTASGTNALKGTTTAIPNGLILGKKFLWALRFNGTDIKKTANNEKNHTFNFDISTNGTGNYSIGLTYIMNGVNVTEYSSSVFLEIGCSANLGTLYYSYCASEPTDTSNFFVSCNTVLIDVFQTTGFGAQKSGSPIKKYTFENEYPVVVHRNDFLNPGQYVLLEISGADCRTAKSYIYLYNDASCRFAITENTTKEASTTLFPNPVENTLSINTAKEISKIEIYTNQGTLIEYVNSPTTEIDFSNKESGMYFVKIFNEDGSVSQQKITKK